jgi:hypothetical protein
MILRRRIIITLGLVTFTIILNSIVLSPSQARANQLYQHMSEGSGDIILKSPVNEGNAKLVNIHTTPLAPKVGEFFRINATVVNELSNDIIFTGNFCGYSSLSAEFSENVIVDELSDVSRCTAIEDITLKQGQNASIWGPVIAVSYLGLSSGKTNTKVTFSYWVQEDKQLITRNVSQSFEFSIYS